MDSKYWTAVDRQIARKQQSIRQVLIRGLNPRVPSLQQAPQARPVTPAPVKPRAFSLL
jgi:hypothetical protein